MSNRHAFALAAETYGVPVPDYITKAQALLDAAQKYKADLLALEAPTLNDVTPTTISKRVDAVLAFAQRDERLALANRIEAAADTEVETAWCLRFKLTLMTDLAEPFDEAAQAFMDVYDNDDPNAHQDPAVVATLGELVRLRDLLTSGRRGDGLPGEMYDLPTRVTVLPDQDAITRKIPVRVGNLTRGSIEWLNAMLSIDGVRLKWHTPAQQAEHVAGLRRRTTA